MTNAEATQLLSNTKSFYRYLMLKNYEMVSSSSMGLSFATLLFLIRQLQILSILEVSKQEIGEEETLQTLKQFFSIVGILVLKFPIEIESKLFELYICIGLFLFSLATLALNLIPSFRKQISEVVSKIITVFSIILPIPITLHLMQTIFSFYKDPILFLNLLLLFLAFFMMLANQLIYLNFHYVFSVKAMKKNVLSRFPQSVVKEFGWIVLAALKYVCLNFAYPNLFIVFLFLCFCFSIYEIKNLATGMEYFDMKVSRNIGILSLLNVSFGAAMISICLNIGMFKNGSTSFIITFYLFSVNFYVTFRKFWIKRIIIDDNTTTQASQIIYVTTFVIFSCDISQKKNQSYTSSLLKNHINNCSESNCCCKNRNQLYDCSTNLKGQVSLQPHLDSVFVKHFYLKMIEDSISEFPKSINLKMFLALFQLQFMHLAPECLKQIKYFSKKSFKEKISLQQEFAMFCLERQLCKFIEENNIAKGNREIEKAKLFDEQLILLSKKIMSGIENLRSFWQLLSSIQPNKKQQQQVTEEPSSLSPSILKMLLKNSLKIMEQIFLIYSKMKQINPLSFELRQMMFFYSRQVMCDVDMFLKVKEQLKMQKMNGKQYIGKSKSVLDTFNKKTANLVVRENNKICWVSNNAKLVFGYKKNVHILSSTANSLMPAFFAKNHDNLVKQWIRTGKCIKMNKTTQIWCKKQNGSCFKALIYMKMMPNFLLFADKSIDYYVSIESIGRNEIICGKDGEIYGCDEGLEALIRCPMKFIQNYKPNIQIFFPLLFSYFFPYFFKWNQNTKKNNIEVCSGYVPGKCSNFIQLFSKQKQSFIRKNKRNKLFDLAYESFLEVKMQQATMQLQGKYLSVEFEIDQSQMLGHWILVVKILNIDIDKIEEYYRQIEETTNLLNLVKIKSQSRGKLQSMQKKIDLYSNESKFQAVFNPTKLIKAKKGIKVERNSADTMSRRKQRAINQLVEIKNERVKRNIQKIKKVLFENGVISANTLKILTEKRDVEKPELFQPIQQQNDENSSSVKKQEKSSKIILKNFQSSSSSVFHEVEPDELLSDDQLLEQREKVSFQGSIESSSTLISLSTKIRQIKQKLTQKNMNLLLTITNVLFFMIIIGINIGNFSRIDQFFNIMEVRKLTSQHLYRTFKLTESLMSSKSLQFSMTSMMNNALVLIANALINIFAQISYEQLLQQNFLADTLFTKKIQLNYIHEKVSSSLKNLTLRDFYLRQYNQIVNLEVTVDTIEYSKVIEKIEKVANKQDKSRKNPKIEYMIGGVFLINGFVIWNLYKANTKFKEIMVLLKQIYPRQKKKYMKIYTKLLFKAKYLLKILKMSESLEAPKKSIETSHQILADFLLNSRYGEKQMDMKMSIKLKSFCIKVWLVFILIYAAVGVAFLIRVQFCEDYLQQQFEYNQVLIGKIGLTKKLIELESSQINKNVEIESGVEAQLIHIFNSGANSPSIKELISNFSTLDLCHTLQKYQFHFFDNQTISLVEACKNISNSLFTSGALNSFPYLQQSISFYSTEKSTMLPQTALNIALTSAITTLLTFDLLNNFLQQKQANDQHFFELSIWLSFAVLVSCIASFILWRDVCTIIEQNNSRQHQLLLVLPFELLLGNPYLRQYLRKQFKITFSPI